MNLVRNAVPTAIIADDEPHLARYLRERLALAWPELKIVEVPSTHTKLPIYAKLYVPKDFDASKKYPAVLFVHG